MTSHELYKLLREYRLVLTKGSIFGPTEDGFMRMDIVCKIFTVKRKLELIEKNIMKKLKNSA